MHMIKGVLGLILVNLNSCWDNLPFHKVTSQLVTILTDISSNSYLECVLAVKMNFYYNLSSSMRNPFFGVSSHAGHKLDCTDTEDS